MGSFGVLIWSIIWCRYANQLEDEIEAENAAVESGTTNGAQGAAASSQDSLTAGASV
ncbi:hypothetical protein RKLH11_1296 [Rhodobacteraceae bacterium KLH11]|nr:hypothetical protein RKLH11_1296 [Rhodobacteraceae bacterium KLH11]